LLIDGSIPGAATFGYRPLAWSILYTPRPCRAACRRRRARAAAAAGISRCRTGPGIVEVEVEYALETFQRVLV
jgi:hypothetical protein